MQPSDLLRMRVPPYTLFPLSVSHLQPARLKPHSTTLCMRYPSCRAIIPRETQAYRRYITARPHAGRTSLLPLTTKQVH